MNTFKLLLSTGDEILIEADVIGFSHTHVLFYNQAFADGPQTLVRGIIATAVWNVEEVTDG